MALVVCQLSALAQKDLYINELFEGKIVPPNKMVETRVRGRSLSKYGLTFFRSVRYKSDSPKYDKVEKLLEQDIDRLPAQDCQRIKKRHTSLVYLQLPPVDNKQRLLCYKDKDCEVLVIYTEGPKATLETLKKMYNE